MGEGRADRCGYLPAKFEQHNGFCSCVSSEIQCLVFVEEECQIWHGDVESM